jgi:hypothetical protein
MTDPTSELLACPCCGVGAVRLARPQTSYWSWIGCYDCGLGLGCNNEKDEATQRETWNRRA